jgi:TQXA domain-containing protein/LPXTG-motif cell wall-anchored protein
VLRRGLARLAAAALVSGLVTAGAVTVADAATGDEGPQQGGATATLGELKTFGAAVVHDHGRDQQVSAGLFEMAVDNGGTLQTYCIDIQNPTQQDAKYHETPWSGTSLHGNADAGRIGWILQHSYPQVNDLATLARQAHAPALTEQDAAAGTQVAIWRYSDHADVHAVSPAAEKLADYLQRSARTVAEPRASLSLTPSAVSGRTGKLLGPVTVHTDATQVTVTPPADAAASGIRIVDAQDNPVTTAENGSKLYFDVPHGAMAGTAELTVQASTTVPVGRAFTSETRSQTQILAGSSESTVSAVATADWAKAGPIPALSAAKDCGKHRLDITAANEGDEPFTFTLLGLRHTITAGTTRTVTVPLAEDQAYDFTIKGESGGAGKRFRGVLDCRTQSDAGLVAMSQPSPASWGSGSNTNLAETGTSNATPVLAGIALALVVVGGLAVFLVRRKKPTEPPAGD